MNAVILGKYDQTTFQDAVEKHVEKLTFNTKEEYFSWVSQWKEDYKHISIRIKQDKLSRFTLPEKVAKADEEIKRLDSISPDKTQQEVIDRITKQLDVEYGIKFQYWKPSPHTIAMYLLVARRASKLRAGVKMRENKLATASS